MSILANSVGVRIATRVIVLTLALVMLCVAASSQISRKKVSQNHSPSVTLTASPKSLCYGGEVKLFADANDPDEDKLTYKYRATVGQIIGKGREVRWKLGGMGYYKVEVEVSDGRGGVTSSSTEITIFELCNCPSLMMDGSVDMAGTESLATFSISLSGPADINPTYSWSVSAGKIISGKGTQTIKVETAGVETENITATVKIGGLAPECESMKSFTVKNPSHKAP